MRLQILTLTITCLAAAPVWAGAGLTSAGADPTPTNNQPDEPTLAQVAPTQGTSAAAGTSAAGTVVPGTAAAQAGTVTGPGGTASGASTGGATAPAKTLVATPPPPPDPATLPVSVIRPLNKDATSAPAAADGSAPVDTAVAQQARVSTPSATPARPVATPPTQSMPSGGLRAAATSPSPHADAATHTPAETPADEPADASSSGFIFYTGVGIAATILLLSFAAFFRGGGAETGKPGSM